MSFNLLQFLEDEEKKLLASVMELFASFKSHPDVQAVTVASAEAPAVVPEAAVAAPPSVAPPASVTQSTDAAAPGFVPPPQAPTAPVVEPTVDPDWNSNMGYKTGLIMVPARWGEAGNFVRAENECEIHFAVTSTQPRKVEVGQGSIPQAPSVTVETQAGTFNIDLGAPSDQSAGVVTPVNGEIVVKLTNQVGGCVVKLGFPG